MGNKNEKSSQEVVSQAVPPVQNEKESKNENKNENENENENTSEKPEKPQSGLKLFLQEFLCCSTKKEDSPQIDLSSNNKQEEALNYNNDELINGVYSLFPSKFIRPDEKDKIKFSQESIIEYINNLKQSNFVNKYEEKYIKLSLLDKNELSKDTIIIRTEIIEQKNLFKKNIPSLQTLVDAILVPKIRLKWECNYKIYEIIQKINDNTEIVRSVSTPQLTMISEREFIDKRTHFFDSEGVFYSFSSSVPDELYPPKKIKTEGGGEEFPVRVIDYLGILIIKEDEENFYIDSINQVDIKMCIQEALLVMSFPFKMKEYFDQVIGYFNK